MPDWDERYRKGEHASLEPHPLLVQFVQTAKPGRALDLACGAGRHALFLAQHGWRVTAVDASAIAIDLTLQRAKETGLVISTCTADLERGEFIIDPNGYDLVLDFYYLQRDLFPSIRAGVKPDGAFVGAIHLASEDSSQDAGRNPAFLLKSGELRSQFKGWRIHHYEEGAESQPSAGDRNRGAAEIIAIKTSRQ